MTDQQAMPLGLKLSPRNPEYQKDPFTLLDDVREEARVVRDEFLGRLARATAVAIPFPREV